MSTTTTRSRTVTWEDPLPAVERGMSMSGIDYLRAMEDDELPHAPIARLLGFEPFEVREGLVAFESLPGEHHYNPIGLVHGGFAATLLDSAMGCAVHSLLPAGAGYSTLEIKVNYVRALTAATGRVRAIGSVVHLGSRTATAEGRLVDDEDRLYAHATTTCLVVRP
ncbi:MAG TPA: PaaI family thioesterase [Solirubrobacteraceae bacterium]|nr:PaaI family thioesterase [Solirubrobacteraceae bacterium]